MDYQLCGNTTCLWLQIRIKKYRKTHAYSLGWHFEHRAQSHNQSGCVTAVFACSGTKCDKRMHYKNFGPGKAWDHTLINHSMYLSMPGELSPWSTVPGWSLESTTFDFMHNLYL